MTGQEIPRCACGHACGICATMAKKKPRKYAARTQAQRDATAHALSVLKAARAERKARRELLRGWIGEPMDEDAARGRG